MNVTIYAGSNSVEPPDADALPVRTSLEVADGWTVSDVLEAAGYYPHNSFTLSPVDPETGDDASSPEGWSITGVFNLFGVSSNGAVRADDTRSILWREFLQATEDGLYRGDPNRLVVFDWGSAGGLTPDGLWDVVKILFDNRHLLTANAEEVAEVGGAIAAVVAGSRWVTGALVEQAVKALRRASRLSRLPDDLAEWGGRPFLRIAFSEPDRTAVGVRVGEVVDRVAGQYATRAVGPRNRQARRDGMALLLEAVHAAVSKGFTVDVLKPDSVLRDERVSIEEMNDVFSGGQELTAAIVLYCTLAALAANERGEMRSRHSGVLFLDNPIGRANASYLIDLQPSVARSLGVQLVYTTGISDDRVLAAFRLWVRLRNDADLRAGMKYIQVADVVRRQLPAPYADDDDPAAPDVSSLKPARRPVRSPRPGCTDAQTHLSGTRPRCKLPA